MIQVRFNKQWRGHDPDTVVDLEDWRAEELIDGGYCKATSDLQDKPKRGRKPKAVTANVVEPSPVFSPHKDTTDKPVDPAKFETS